MRSHDEPVRHDVSESPDGRDFGDALGAAAVAEHSGHAGASGDLTVAEAGEAGVLARILPASRPARAAIVPTGDDAAVVAAPDGRYAVTTDLMVEGPDFRRDWSSADDIGRKACASNLADVAAMGARPTAVVIALAVPDDTPVAWVEGFGAGFAAALAELAPDCGIVGGDLSTSRQIVVSVTAFGDLEGRAPVLRSGARPGDVVALAGHAGRSASGLAVLLADGGAARGTERVARGDGVGGSGDSVGGSGERVEWGGDDVEGGVDAAFVRASVVRAHLAPVPPIDAGPRAADAGATAMMDVSDGLLLDATRLARASGVVIDLDPEAFADDIAFLRGLGIDERDALERCLTGGEDHALLATFPPGAVLPPPFRRIGVVLDPVAGGAGVEPVGAAAGEAAGTVDVREGSTPDVAAQGSRAGGAARVRVAGVGREPVGWDPYAR